MNKDSLVKENLKNFLINMIKVDDSYEILTFIFEYHLAKEDVKYSDLVNHLGNAFKYNPNSLLDYILIDEDFSLTNLGLNQATYKNAYKLVSKLKIKYAGIVKKAFQKGQDPFLLVGGEVNVRNNESTHKIMLERADGEEFNANFKPENLLPINILLTHGLMQSVKVGIFNLDEGMINHYLEVTEEISNFLKGILEKKSVEVDGNKMDIEN